MSGLKSCWWRLANQVGRFSLVGACNTGIDFFVTNLLYGLFLPTSRFDLFLISAGAVLAAGTNSYFMNRYWTFGHGAEKQRFEVAKFMTVAAVGMVVNTSIFLFLTRYLDLLFPVTGVLKINLAKLGAVIGAMSVTFAGYRFWVFEADSLATFKQSFTFPKDRTGVNQTTLGLLIVVALMPRLGFLYLAPVAYGDAIAYSSIATHIGRGDLAGVDVFWHSLFTYWESLLIWLGLGAYQALVLATLIPGVLLVIPIYLTARALFGRVVALLAALVTALHPRLIEYSLNGYSEMFYILFAAWAVWGLVAMFTQQTPTKATGIAIGVGLAGYTLVRNEAVLVVIPLLLLAAWQAWKNRKLRLLVTALLSFTAMCGGYVLLNQSLLGSPGLFQKSSNLQRRFSEQLDFAQAAKETYRADQSEVSPPTLTETIQILAARYPRNLAYVAERFPGILLSPLIFFIPFLWLSVRKKAQGCRASLPLWIVTVFPLLFYPLVQVEPRHFFLSLIGFHIFGAAGLLAFLTYVVQRTGLCWLVKAGSALVIIALLPVGLLLVRHREQKEGFHREVGAWIKSNLAAGSRIMGDGYGYIDNSTFWGQTEGTPRIWADQPQQLVEYARRTHHTILILYEEFLKKGNPELLSVLDSGIEGMVLLHEFSFPKAGRVQVYKLLESDQKQGKKD